MGCHFILQGIFPTRGSNPGLLYCRWILLLTEPSGKPFDWLLTSLWVMISCLFAWQLIFYCISDIANLVVYIFFNPYTCELCPRLQLSWSEIILSFLVTVLVLFLRFLGKTGVMLSLELIPHHWGKTPLFICLVNCEASQSACRNMPGIQPCVKAGHCCL